MTDHSLGPQREPSVEVARSVSSPRALIITCHGGRAHGDSKPHKGRLTYRRMVPFSRMWNAMPGVSVWRLRYRHTGWNGTRRDPVNDLEWALRLARQRHPAAAVIVIGHSMGGRAALVAAGTANVTAVCALAPWLEPTDPVAQLKGRQVLIAHGDRDRITSPVGSRRFAERGQALGATVRHVTVNGAGHAMVRRLGEWRRLTDEFVTEVLRTIPGS